MECAKMPTPRHLKTEAAVSLLMISANQYHCSEEKPVNKLNLVDADLDSFSLKTFLILVQMQSTQFGGKGEHSNSLGFPLPPKYKPTLSQL